MLSLKRNYLSSLLPIAGDVQARLVRQPNDAAAVGIHFINVGISEYAAENDLRVVGRPDRVKIGVAVFCQARLIRAVVVHHINIAVTGDRTISRAVNSLAVKGYFSV